MADTNFDLIRRDEATTGGEVLTLDGTLDGYAAQATVPVANVTDRELAARVSVVTRRRQKLVACLEGLADDTLLHEVGRELGGQRSSYRAQSEWERAYWAIFRVNERSHIETFERTRGDLGGGIHRAVRNIEARHGVRPEKIELVRVQEYGPLPPATSDEVDVQQLAQQLNVQGLLLDRVLNDLWLGAREFSRKEPNVWQGQLGYTSHRFWAAGCPGVPGIELLDPRCTWGCHHAAITSRDGILTVRGQAVLHLPGLGVDLLLEFDESLTDAGGEGWWRSVTYVAAGSLDVAPGERNIRDHAFPI